MGEWTGRRRFRRGRPVAWGWGLLGRLRGVKEGWGWVTRQGVRRAAGVGVRGGSGARSVRCGGGTGRGVRLRRSRATYGAGAVRGRWRGVRGARRDVPGVRHRGSGVVNVVRACSPDGECAAGGVVGLGEAGSGWRVGSGARSVRCHGGPGRGARGAGRGARSRRSRATHGARDARGAQRTERAAHGADTVPPGGAVYREVRHAEPRPAHGAPHQARPRPAHPPPPRRPPRPPRTPRATCINAPPAAPHPAPPRRLPAASPTPPLAAPSPRHPHG